MNVTIFKKKYLCRIIFFTLSFFLVGTTYAQVNPLVSTISTTGQLTVGKVSPGEDLPLQVQLINFGTPEERVDVTLMYSVKDQSGKVLLSQSETVAVQTTASFIKNVTIPPNFRTGTYTIDLLMAYRNQEFPAISQAQFKVENRILGFYKSEWFSASPILLVPFLILFIWYTRRKSHVLVRANYEHIPEEERAYYEIVHEIVNALHYHVGDEKIKEIVGRIDGLTLDESNLYIENMNGSVSTIMSRLVNEYETVTGKKANIIIKPSYPKNRLQTR